MVRMVARLGIVLSWLSLAVLSGCSGGSQSAKCVPGASAECYCPSGEQGAQICTLANTFGACVCATPIVDAGGPDGSDGGTSGPPDAAITLGGSGGIGGSGGAAEAGGGGGWPAVDAAADRSADAPAVPDAFPDAAVDAEEDRSVSDTTPAILSFTAAPTTISAGKSSTLSWTVTGATMLFVDQGVGSNLVSVLGATSLVVTPSQTTTYTLTLNGTMSAHVTVTVVPLPTITSFSASPAVLSTGGSSTLTAVFSGGTGTVDQGIGAVTSGIGTSTGPISASTTYTLTVTNAVGGSTTAQVTVVGAPPVNGLAVWVLTKPTGSTGQIGLNVRIDNQTTQSVDMSTVTLRYWYQDEGLGTALVLASNYASVGYSGQGKVTSGTAVANPSPVTGADHYLELSFAATLSAKGDVATNDQFTVQVNLHTAGYTGAVDVTNDYSYDGGAEGAYEQKITLYTNGKLIWGVEPGTGSASSMDAGVDASADVGDSTDLEAE